ncbi:MEDS domain-containing protein [Streptomyces sp. S.PB5]|uniref:MEDS domain-containing protein n=1 Tax=Streptomyces sp. S.PB5 TaxID=3020844 RepID=UPI0025B0DE5D|nr:MEDS domain-containing protein [Streptomyces sp. S.PB5]MDN3020419.1 MEDS domain-containing protein [Streptomyces sp. S.PB5]
MTETTPDRTVPVERLQLGDHACMSLGDTRTPWKVFTAYTRTSLARREKVLLVMNPDDMNDDDVVALLDGGTGRVAAARQTGQLSLRRDTEMYLPDGRFREDRTIELYTEEVDRSQSEGWAGLRLTADMSWAPRIGLDHERLLDYEAAVAPLFADPLFTAICWYDRERFGEGTLKDMAKVHPLRVLENLDSIDVAETQDGSRVSGSAELGTRAEFVESLREALAHRNTTGPARFVLDLRDLCFMEAHCAWQLISLAGSLPDGSEVTVRCGELLALVLRQLGADDVPQLVLSVEGDEDDEAAG